MLIKNFAGDKIPSGRKFVASLRGVQGQKR